MKTNADLKLPEAPTLTDLQAYVNEMEPVRGFNEQNALEKCLMLGEEVGELFKAVRKSQGMGVDHQNSHLTEVSEELADVLIFLLSIANRYGVDLEQAFREKEAINKQRKWE